MGQVRAQEEGRRFQLPLSGSPRPPNAYYATLEIKTFNSLSRDHRAERYPSTGSTSARFQLPLSGSQYYPALSFSVRAWVTFQLPLSGSLGRLRGTGQADSGDPFNSLSRDHVDRDECRGLRLKCFQLPLSGSPSPIPGFSGSPRHSAAAPFRTNDF